MAAGTSPSIIQQGSGYIVAFEANSGVLWDYNGTTGVNLGLGMYAGTSPSAFFATGGAFWIAFQANTGNLYFYGSGAPGNTGQAMNSLTSPSGGPS